MFYLFTEWLTKQNKFINYCVLGIIYLFLLCSMFGLYAVLAFYPKVMLVLAPIALVSLIVYSGYKSDR